MIAIGILWAVFAPLSLAAAILVGTYCCRQIGRRAALAISAGVVLVPVAALWLFQHAEFGTVCERDGKAIIRATAQADGIRLISPTANSFGTRYLYDEGFAWFEAADITNRARWVRYERGADGKITTRPVDQLQSRYEVKEVTSAPFAHTSLTTVTVVDTATGTEMARAGSAQFDGGTAKWVLGAWGNVSCPSARSGNGFQAYYHLARDTLRK